MISGYIVPTLQKKMLEYLKAASRNGKNPTTLGLLNVRHNWVKKRKRQREKLFEATELASTQELTAILSSKFKKDSWVLHLRSKSCGQNTKVTGNWPAELSLTSPFSKGQRISVANNTIWKLPLATTAKGFRCPNYDVVIMRKQVARMRTRDFARVLRGQHSNSQQESAHI